MDQVFKTRSTTAIIFGIIVIGCIYANITTRMVLFMIAIVGSSYELIKLSKQNHLTVFLFTIISAILMYIGAHLLLERWYLPLLIFTVLAYTVICIVNFYFKGLMHLLPALSIIYPGLSGLIISYEIIQGQFCNFINLLSIILMIWSADSFAYIVGRSLGKRKLFEKISPKKTVEGFAGGIIGTLIIGIVISRYNNTLTVLQWIVIAIVISTIGVAGDLLQSTFKRYYNVKDSGNILPGHGGLYDRFDSLIYLIPFIFFTLFCFKNL